MFQTPWLRKLYKLCVSIAAAFAALSSPAFAGPVQMVVLGDSLSAGYLLPADAAFPAQLEAALKARGLDVTIINAGVSGDTSSGGLARLDWSVPPTARAVIVELGANDALRGIDPAVTEKALDAIVSRLKAKGVAVFVAGMLAPPNMGTAYEQRFNGIYPALGAKYGVPVYPFFLDGIVGNPKLLLQDGMHPTREGVAAIVGRIAPQIEAWLKALPPA